MSPVSGLLLVVLAGALNGTFALPMKRTRRWAFENTWLVYSVVSMLILSWAIPLVTVPHLFTVYERSGPGIVLMAFAFGLLWGLANLLFGIGIHLIGMSLTFPIAIGLSTALGALIPMALRPLVFLTPGGAAISLGIAVALSGVFVCALAGIQKDAQSKAVQSEGVRSKDAEWIQSTEAAGSAGIGKPSRRLIKGLAIVVLSGLCDPFLNFAFTFGERIKREAQDLGSSAGAEADAIWALTLLGSFVVNAVYCTTLLTRNRTWPRYAEKHTTGHWFLAALMAIIWMLSITFYGRGAMAMGRLGSSVGWPVFYSSIILFSSMWGFLSGEWEEGRGRPLKTMAWGLVVLLVAVVILGYGNGLPTQ